MRELNPDATARKILGKGLFNFFKGDDGLLRSIANYIEKEAGIRLKAIQDFMPDLLPKAGLLAGTFKDEGIRQDIEKAQTILTTLSPHDIGQALVIEKGLILGIEAIEGTDALIKRSAGLLREHHQAILVKAPKLSQSNALDLPTIGLQTVELLVEHHFAGLAVAAGQTLMPQQASMVALMEKYGKFIYAFEKKQT